MNETARKDVLICGVNGFTAKKLLEHIVTLRPNMTVGVTCRSKSKLDMTFIKIFAKCKKSLSHVETHIIDVNHIGNLASVFRGYKVVINCIGPFAKTGLAVVEACIRAHTHYVDCSGEPMFIEESFQLFQEKARTENVIIAHACGFDSLPLDIGIVYTMNEIKSKNGSAVCAESYMQLINSRINLGTFKTIINSLDMLKSRNKHTPALNRKVPALNMKKETGACLPKIKKVRKLPFISSDAEMYAVLFPGSDAYVLRKTRALLGNSLPVCHCYIAAPTILGMAFLVFLCFLIGLVYILPNALRRIFYEHIDLLSFGAVRYEGPTEQEILCSGFKTKIFTRGADKNGKDTTFKTFVSGPDPGYITTPVTLLVSAETILDNVSGALMKKGGVHTPGSLFAGTNIIQRLSQENIVFCTVTDVSKP